LPRRHHRTVVPHQHPPPITGQTPRLHHGAGHAVTPARLDRIPVDRAEGERHGRQAPGHTGSRATSWPTTLLRIVCNAITGGVGAVPGTGEATPPPGLALGRTS